MVETLSFMIVDMQHCIWMANYLGAQSKIGNSNSCTHYRLCHDNHKCMLIKSCVFYSFEFSFRSEFPHYLQSKREKNEI